LEYIFSIKKNLHNQKRLLWAMKIKNNSFF
jgi:hypothetical protein